MSKLNFLVITLLLSVSTIFFSEGKDANVLQHTFPQHTIQASPSLDSQGIIVNSDIELSVNLQLEDNTSFYKQYALVKTVNKTQQNTVLLYQKSSNSIAVGLPKTQIIYPFHWFT